MSPYFQDQDLPDWDNNSTFMLHRQHHPDGNPELAAQMKRFFRLPNNTDKETRFGDFVYLTQVIQAVCLQAQSEHYRARKMLTQWEACTGS
eukprot:m.96585 g.96585  ORF g.96585 m.96585 type:complete len:91 (+) comp36913_c0_seq6:1711-1983(+)